MAHALAAHGGAGDFYTALIADDTFITGVFVFAAVTLPVSSGAKNGFTEQAVFFWSQTAVVDSFGLENLTV
jgi:hypothetical protein